MGSFYFKTEVLNRLSAIEAALKTLIRKEDAQMSEIDNLQTAVANETSVDQSAVTLLQQLGDFIRSHANDPAAIQAFADQLTQNQQALADAISANTDAAGGGTPTPAPAAGHHTGGHKK